MEAERIGFRLVKAYPNGYIKCMYTILRTDQFDTWLKKLRDPIGKARIIARIRSAEEGNFGDSKSVGGGVSEMKVDCGPGYRLYYIREGDLVYLLLCGGDKSSQERDIKKAKELAHKRRGTFQ